jgi:hypothetical protein
MRFWRRLRCFVFCVALCTALGGCAGISRGIAEAVLDRKVEDTRQCQMQGPKFTGLRQSLAQHVDGTIGATKVLMVHGVSHHTTGYSNRFRDRLVAALELDIVDPEVKNIRLVAPDLAKEPDGREPDLGTLRVTRHVSRDGKRSLLFYELTWSAITENEKKLILYDTANTEGLGRSGINHTLKGFMNATVPDLLIYMGSGHAKITAAVRESVCWMFSNDWHGLPSRAGRHACYDWQKTDLASIAQDDYFFVTHSLGSRITLDTLQSFATDSSSALAGSRLESIRGIVRHKDFTVFMLANQLPLLQMGRAEAKVTGQYRAYCTANGERQQERILRRLNIVALSDPNDILSYPVQDDFAQQYIDSRVCPRLANVSINVAQQRDILGAASFADPLTAHNGYLEDPRVISLITDGTGGAESAGPADGKCQWQEVRRTNHADK